MKQFDQTFPAPSFGEDYHIPQITSAGSTLSPNTHSHQNGYTAQVPTPPASGASQGLGYTQPLTHIPVTSASCGLDNNTHSGAAIDPKFPPQTFDIPDISFTSYCSPATLTNCSVSVPYSAHFNGNNHIVSGIRHIPPTNYNHVQLPLTTISPRDIRAQLGFRHPMAATHGSPPGSNNTSPGRESSEDSDDSLPLAQLALKRSAEANQQTVPPVSVVTGASAAKKAKTTSKKKKKKDPNEPQKPVSAYALFFRDTQAAIKGQNPNASFGEVSKIVASMWDSLDEEQKNVYKKKTEVAKKEYLKQLAAYRASLVSKGAAEAAEQAASQPKPIMPSPMGAGPAHPMQPLQEGMPPYMSPHHMGSMEMMGAHQMPPPNAPNPAEQHHHQMPNSPPQAMPMSPQMMQMNEQHMQVMSPDGSMSSPGPPMCVRPGCQNAPIEHPSWDQEFCSSGCVVDHCRDVFTAWVASRQNSYASVK